MQQEIERQLRLTPLVQLVRSEKLGIRNEQEIPAIVMGSSAVTSGLLETFQRRSASIKSTLNQ